MTKILKCEQVDPINKKTIENDTILCCSKCGTELVNIIQTEDDILREEFLVKAICGVCGDHSFELKVNGLFRYSECENGVVGIRDIQNEGMNVTIYTSKI